MDVTQIVNSVQVTSTLLINNLWIIVAALFILLMTVAVGFLEVGELGESFSASLMKTIVITGTAIFVMAIIGFNTAFAPTFYGIIGNPFYKDGLLLGGFSSNAAGLLNGVWWSMGPAYFNTGLTTGTYYFFETAAASVTLALVAVIVLKKVKFQAFFIFSIVYFITIWNIPVSWIWNPTGWLYMLGMRDFAGGLVVHAAAATAGMAIVFQIWREEKKRGLRETLREKTLINEGWLALAILLLWVGWFGFNPGSVLAFNSDVLVVGITTFVSSAAAMVSTLFFRYVFAKQAPDILYAVNGILMGLVVITPLAGFVSPASALILGLVAGPLFLVAEKFFSARKWFSDPVGLFPEHGVGGIFGILMIAFFTQNSFAAASGNPSLPNGFFFGGGFAALNQFGIELLGIAAVVVTVFLISFATIWVISLVLHGITSDSTYGSTVNPTSGGLGIPKSVVSLRKK